MSYSSVRSGSFVYDVEIPSLSNWKPTGDELRVFSAEMVKLSLASLPVERLTVSEKLASEIFDGQKYKLEQIPGVADRSPGTDDIFELTFINDWIGV